MNQPESVHDVERQEELIKESAWDWLLLLDAGRADVFEDQLIDSFLPASDDAVGLTWEYNRADNGGIGYTATWFEVMFPDEYDLLMFHGGQPIHSMRAGDYDERQHFKIVPGMWEYEFDEGLATVPPEAVNDVVREYRAGAVEERLESLGYAAESTPDRGVVRYLQPHAPFRELVDATKGRGTRVTKTAQQVRAGDLSIEEVREAYVDNYEWGIKAVGELIEELEGTIVVTADHGECLGDCGQWYHGGGHDMHDHLTTVPWLVIEK